MNEQPTLLQKIGTKRLAVLLISIIILLVAGYVGYLTIPFRITGTNPNPRNMASITPFFKIEFNKALSSDGLALSGTPTLIKSYSINGKELVILLNYPLQINKPYTLTLDSIKSSGGQAIMHKRFTFTPQNIPIEQLPQDQQEALTNEQDKNQGASADPIVGHLPYGNLDFSLSALVSNDDSNTSRLTLSARLLLSNADMSNEQAAIDSYKKEVTDYISSLGLNPANYDIRYTVVTPTQ